MPTLSPTANKILQATLDAMQPADELGGPNIAEYIDLMDAIVAEAAQRAATARAHHARPLRASAPDLARALERLLEVAEQGVEMRESMDDGTEEQKVYITEGQCALKAARIVLDRAKGA